MHTVATELQKPSNDVDFEHMCASIYGHVFNDPLPKINGRRGQAQGGVDVFVKGPAGLIGIQSKRVVDGALTLAVVETEIGRADKAAQPIERLIVATTSRSDAPLLAAIRDLSKTRVAAGLYAVEVEFWDEICDHVHRSAALQELYAPHTPGAAFHRQEAATQRIAEKVSVIAARLDAPIALSDSRQQSVNRFIDVQLDTAKKLIGGGAFRDAVEWLGRIGADMSLLDQHQQARWYQQRGVCAWQMDDDTAAASDFKRASTPAPDDDRMVAAGVRSHLLERNLEAALPAATAARERFPASLHVWLAHANAEIVAGRAVAVEDAPMGSRESPDVMHMAAWSLKVRGRPDDALAVLEKAVSQPEAGFSIRGLGLAIALERAVRDPVVVAHDMNAERDLNAVRHFLERIGDHDVVLALQAPSGRDELLVHMAYARLILGDPLVALQIADDANARGASSSRLEVVALTALRRMERLDEVISRGGPQLHELPEEGLLQVAEVAANAGDLALVERAMAVPDASAERVAILEGLRWVALTQTPDGRDVALQEIASAGLEHSNELIRLSCAARATYKFGSRAMATALVDRSAALLMERDRPSNERLLVADLLLTVERFDEAARIYAGLAPEDRFSDLHTRLLRCYVRGGRLRDARSLLESFSDGWADDDETRQLAIEVGQRAGDWGLVRPLATLQLEKRPRAASSHLLATLLEVRSGRHQAAAARAVAIPAVVDGSIQQIAQLAALQVVCGQLDQGRRRLVSLFRDNLQSVEAASLLLTIWLTSPLGSVMAPAPLNVMAGTVVGLRDPFGRFREAVIEPEDEAPHPEQPGFYTPDHAVSQQLLGKSVGDAVPLDSVVPDNRYTVESVVSFDRFLLARAQALVDSSIAMEGVIRSMPADPAYIHAELKVAADHTKRVMEAYAKGQLTLGVVAQLINRGLVDTVFGFPTNRAALHVCEGSGEEQAEASSLLARVEASYVMDASALLELATLDVLSAARVLPQIAVASTTREAISLALDQARASRATATIWDDDGVLRMAELTEADSRRRTDVFERVLAFIDTECTVRPAYGLPGAPDHARLLGQEQNAAVLLASENGATLVTLDGRLSSLARALYDVKRVWPQAVLRHALETSRLDPASYSHAVATLFVANRWFVSVGGPDLAHMCLQGGYLLRQGLSRLKQTLSDPRVDFESTLEAALLMVRILMNHRIQVGAVYELIAHLVEAALRHPHCPWNGFAERMESYFMQLLELVEPHPEAYPAFKRARRLRVAALRDGLKTALERAEARAKEAPSDEPVRVKTLMISTPPTIYLDTAQESPTRADITDD